MSVAVFLQGPHGPFFAKLARRLSQQGIVTHKINFNGGDRHFSWANFQVDFSESENDWADFFKAYLVEHAVKVVFVYGDCRSYHSKARDVCKSLGVAFGVFEEGYLRPDFITLEWGGVNAYSNVDWSREAIDEYQSCRRKLAPPVGQTFWHRAIYATRYYVAMRLCRSRFPSYHHHRNRDWKAETGCWLLSFVRKGLYRLTECHLMQKLTSQYRRRFFLFPLQTRDDFQLREHSDLLSIENSIDRVLKSFAKNAPADTVMVIKHHPMDRGFCHYQQLIDSLEARYGIQGRVIYCHDLHLPTLLQHALGVVTINSTVGISALLHEVPTKLLGRALYDMPGLTHQGPLASFWSNPEKVDISLFTRFHTYLYEQTQLDGSFARATKSMIEAVVSRMTEVSADTPSPGLPWVERRGAI
ncbi:capsule biosynthesis protein [Microbulbifer sp. SSSA002]|uniref:capsule biosynthesis protein n=1 Tax=unclassified Microbulbifer TaxID=2619833 RepID=UPI00403A1F7A